MIIKSHPNANALWSENEKEIKIIRKIISDKEKLFGATLHEICHMVSGATDATIDFENELTTCLGELVNWLWNPDK